MRARCFLPLLSLLLWALPARAQEPAPSARWDLGVLGGFAQGKGTAEHSGCGELLLAPGAEIRRTGRYGYVGARVTIPLMPQTCDIETGPPPLGSGSYTHSYWRGELAQPWPHPQAAAGVVLDHPEGVRYTLQALAGLLPVRWREEVEARPTVSALVGLGTDTGPLTVEAGCTWSRALRVRDVYQPAKDPGRLRVLVASTETAHWPRLCGAGVRWRATGF